jgi:hypothetical protein
MVKHTGSRNVAASSSFSRNCQLWGDVSFLLLLSFALVALSSFEFDVV